MSSPDQSSAPGARSKSNRAELNADMEKVELHAFGLRAMIDTAQAELGADTVTEMLQRFGMTRARLSGKDSWASMSFVEGFLSEMVQRAGDPAIIDRLSEASISAKYLGAIYPLIRAFGSPGIVYDQVVKSSPRFNKVGAYKVLEQRPGFVRLDYRPTPGAPCDSTVWFCRSRLVQLACIPKLFGLAPARYEHPQCMVRGDESCVYELTWQVPRREGLAWAGLGVGILIGAGAAVFGHTSAVMDAFIVFVSGLAGWALARGVQLAETNELRVTELHDHHEALKQSIRQNEERFSELLAAKAEVDSRVEARTHELRATGEKLSETLKQVQALDRAKTDFFNNVSHELRTPLTLILAPLDDLLAGRNPAGGRQSSFESMQRNASRLLQLINQLLDLAKVDAGKMTLARAPTDVIEFVRNQVRLFEGAALRKNIALAFEGPPGPIVLALDTRWMESAMTNLIANAVHYVGESGRITVRVVDRAGEVAFEVEDDGPGMAPQDAEQVFERFAQASEGRRGRTGTGLGLPIVREAARLHGGEASVSSELGKGSTFRITLLRTPNAVSDDASVEPVKPQRAVSPHDSLSPQVPQEHELEPGNDVVAEGAGPLVLVVEDHPDLRLYISNVLATRFRVRSAVDGVGGLAIAQSEFPELIISDVSMPRMDGYELCRRVRAERNLTGTPILLLTARSDPSAVMEGFEAGASDYIVKPFHPRELLARVQVHVHLRRLLRDTAAHGRLAMLGLVAASVAHQARNPLTSLVSGLPAIRTRLKESLEPRTLELLDVMIDCAARIERLTTDLMDVSRIDREEEVEFAPGKSLLACVRLASPRITEGEIKVREHVDIEAHLRGRPGDLHHAILNVLDNAARAIVGQGEIELIGYVTESHYVMEIGDSGTGVPRELREQIFEPFWTSRPAGHGTGLGLAIARQLIQEHGGTVTAGESPLGGASFQIKLPLTRAALPHHPNAA